MEGLGTGAGCRSTRRARDVLTVATGSDLHLDVSALRVNRLPNGD
jgi:hypothetical protein